MAGRDARAGGLTMATATGAWPGRIPWLLAIAGLLVPLVGSGFVVWPISAIWAVLLAGLWMFGRLPLTRGDRIARGERILLGVAALPVLFLLAWEGGWYFLPAVLAWLAIQVARHDPGASAAG